MDKNALGNMVVWLVPTVFAIVVHEVAHGWAALQLGDTTARDAGRLSLNPLRHVDPFGTIILPLLMVATGLKFVFGWAKPVPVNFLRLRNLRVGTVIVAAAGPLANLAMLAGWRWLFGLAGKLEGSQALSPTTVTFLEDVALSGILVNVALFVFNLIPLPPLDGGRIVGALLPPALSKPYMKLEKYGIFILLALIATGLFNKIFQPLLSSVFMVLAKVIG